MKGIHLRINDFSSIATLLLLSLLILLTEKVGNILDFSVDLQETKKEQIQRV